MEEKIQKLINLGGCEWKKSDKHRIYFNQDVLADLIGLSVNRYNTGNVSSASMNGEAISNSKAKKILTDLYCSKFHYDVIDKTWRSNGLGSMMQEIVDIINNKIN